MNKKRYEEMVKLTVRNTRTLAHEQWEIGEMGNSEMLNDLADKLENGTITDEEFDELLEQIEE